MDIIAVDNLACQSVIRTVVISMRMYKYYDDDEDDLRDLLDDNETYCIGCDED